MGSVGGIGGVGGFWNDPHFSAIPQSIIDDLKNLAFYANKTDSVSVETFQSLSQKVQEDIEAFLNKNPNIPPSIQGILVGLPIEINNLAKMVKDYEMVKKNEPTGDEKTKKLKDLDMYMKMARIEIDQNLSKL